MGSTTTHGFPYPVGTDRLADGDNAIQQLAQEIDRQLYLGSNVAPGIWQTATGIVLCTDTSLSAVAGSSVSRAVFMKIGHTVWFQGDAMTGATAASSAGISLPNSQAGVPVYRAMACGTLGVFGPSAPADQTGLGYMHLSKDRLMVVAFSAGYRSCPASHAIRWSVVYEVA